MSPRATGRRRAVAVAAGAGLALLAAAGVVAVSLVSATSLAAAKRTPLPTTSAGVTTFSGTVQSGATRLAGVRVGFWSRTGRDVTHTTTGAKGAFTLRVPSGIRGFAYAGARPDAPRAVFALKGASYVRGVIGATEPTGTASPIHQGHASAVPARLAGGQALRFDLQRPGRLRVAGAALAGGDVALLRLNNVPIRSLDIDASGVALSEPLVPGKYLLGVQPSGDYVGQRVRVTVRAGATTRVSPSFVKGVAVRGTVTAGGAPADGVRVVLEQAGRMLRESITDQAGRYDLALLGPGDYRLRFAVPPRSWPPDLEPYFDVPGSASNDYRPLTKDLSLGATTRIVDVSLQRANQVTGTVTGLRDIEFGRVWLEDETHTIVATRGTDGEDFAKDVRRYRLGGLVAGRTYTVLSATDRLYGAATFTATAGTVTQPVALTAPTLTLSGTAPGAARGGVEVRARGTALARYGGSAHIDATGRYVVRGLIPAAYEVRAVSRDLRDRMPGPWHRLTLTRSTTLDLDAGPAPGRWRGRFVSGAAPVPKVNLQVVDDAGRRTPFPTSAADGRVQVDIMGPGTYRYRALDDFLIAAPVLDGPWWFGPPTGTFTIREGSLTDVGDAALHVHAR